MKERGTFSGKLGFILAAAGSSVGLGNIWRFPYLAAKYGGGLFVLIYIILVATIGSTLMQTEVVLGRRSQCDVYNTYKTLDKRFSILGIMGIIIPIFIATNYSVVGGWVIKYLIDFASGNSLRTAAPNYFSNYISTPLMPIIFHSIFIILSMLVLLCGVKKGIERSNKILMPALLIITIIISIKGITLPGGLEGVKFYLIPDFSKFTLTSVLMAIGQVFYSLSLAMGIMITYGSYMGRDIDIQHSIKMTELFDTSVAILGGLMIVPAVFAASGGNSEAINVGPGLLFETLPKVFEQIPFGNLFGTLFFLLALFAALTSIISLMEVVIAWLIDKFNFSRTKATIAVSLLLFLTGIPSSLGYGIWKNVTIFKRNIFDFIDYTANSILMPLIAIATCIFVGYFLGAKTIFEEAELSAEFKHKKYYSLMIKVIVPICIAAIWISAVFNIS